MRTYTRSQYEAQARFLREQIADEDRRLSELHKIPFDVRANHERTILMRRSHYEKRLSELQVHINQ